MAPQIPWGLIFTTVFAFYSLYKFFKYYQTEECQEYRLFRSEYDIYVNKRKRLIAERENKENQVFRLINRLSDGILDQELRNTSINKIDTPLISLGKLDMLFLLKKLYGRVIVS